MRGREEGSVTLGRTLASCEGHTQQVWMGWPARASGTSAQDWTGGPSSGLLG